MGFENLSDDCSLVRENGRAGYVTRKVETPVLMKRASPPPSSVTPESFTKKKAIDPLATAWRRTYVVHPCRIGCTTADDNDAGGRSERLWMSGRAARMLLCRCQRAASVMTGKGRHDGSVRMPSGGC
jgi:hypothetical protein